MQQTELCLNQSTKRTRKREFLAQMERVVPWGDLVALIAPYAPKGKKGRPPFAVQTMLRVPFMQQWFTLSDPAMEEALHDVPQFREFAQLSWDQRLPDESTILQFRHLLEKHKLAEQILAVVNDLLTGKGLMLKAGTVVDATLIAAPSSTKNSSGDRDPEMHQTKKGNQWYFGMTSPKGEGQRAAQVRAADAAVRPHKAHIGVDAESGLVHTVRGTAANVNDVVEGNSLLHGGESDVFADAGYQGAHKRPNAKGDARWHVPIRPGKRRALDKNKLIDQLTDKIEKTKASIRAKVEHPFRVIKRQFGHVKVRYRGLAKNTAQLKTLFALSNLWQAREKLLVLDGQVRLKTA